MFDAFVHGPDVVVRVDAHRVREGEAVEALADLAHVSRRSDRTRTGASRRCACRRRCGPSNWWRRRCPRPDRGWAATSRSSAPSRRESRARSAPWPCFARTAAMQAAFRRRARKAINTLHSKPPAGIHEFSRGMVARRRAPRARGTSRACAAARRDYTGAHDGSRISQRTASHRRRLWRPRRRARAADLRMRRAAAPARDAGGGRAPLDRRRSPGDRAPVRAGAVPFVARGHGTGLSGGALPVAGGLVIALSRLNRVLDVDIPNQRVTVEPGVTNLDITQQVAPFGYYYAPDPSSQQVCSIGGNVAENSGGAHCLKYGFTVHHVLGVEAVLPNGDARASGRRARRHAGSRSARPDRRLRRHARRRDQRHGADSAPAGDGADAAGGVRHDRRRRRGGVGHHRRRHHSRGGGDDGLAGDSRGRSRRASELSRRRHGADRRARRPGGGSAARSSTSSSRRAGATARRRSRSRRPTSSARASGAGARRRSPRWDACRRTTTCRTASCRARSCPRC